MNFTLQTDELKHKVRQSPFTSDSLFSDPEIVKETLGTLTAKPAHEKLMEATQVSIKNLAKSFGQANTRKPTTTPKKPQQKAQGQKKVGGASAPKTSPKKKFGKKNKSSK